MHVGVTIEHVYQVLVAGQHGRQPQLKLRVIGADQFVALARHERRADVPAQLGAHRNILQVRIGAVEPASLGVGQAKSGVQSRIFIHLPWQSINICVLELGHLAVLRDQVDDRVLAAQFVQLAGRRADSRSCPF